jgi:Anti-sigma-D factor RsdA to sigma factor binding region
MNTPSLAAVRADDALLDALGGRGTITPAPERSDDLSALLLAWRRDVDTRPAPELVSTRQALQALTGGE